MALKKLPIETLTGSAPYKNAGEIPNKRGENVTVGIQGGSFCQKLTKKNTGFPHCESRFWQPPSHEKNILEKSPNPLFKIGPGLGYIRKYINIMGYLKFVGG